MLSCLVILIFIKDDIANTFSQKHLSFSDSRKDYFLKRKACQ